MSSVICVLVNCFNCITVHCSRLRFVNRIVSINEYIYIYIYTSILSLLLSCLLLLHEITLLYLFIDVLCNMQSNLVPIKGFKLNESFSCFI